MTIRMYILSFYNKNYLPSVNIPPKNTSYVVKNSLTSSERQKYPKRICLPMITLMYFNVLVL